MIRDGRFNKQTWLINQLRRISSFRYPPANKARSKNKVEYYILSKKGKQLKRVKYTCEICRTPNLKTTQVNLDHVVPVVEPAVGFVDWNTFIDRLFCDESNFQIICIPCHDIKTSLEDAQRPPRPPKTPKLKKVKKIKVDNK